MKAILKEVRHVLKNCNNQAYEQYRQKVWIVRKIDKTLAMYNGHEINSNECE